MNAAILKPLALALLAGTALGGCSTDSSLKTTPTFTKARYVPQVGDKVIPVGKLSGIDGSRGAQGSPAAAAPSSLSGPGAVMQANSISIVRPTPETMVGATWVINHFDQNLTYEIPLSTLQATIVMLPEGEEMNSIAGGNVDAFVVTPAYVGARPALSILPRYRGAKGNMIVMGTEGWYPFKLYVGGVATTAVSIPSRLTEAQRPGTDELASRSASAKPIPRGEFTPLQLHPAGDSAESKALPAWSPQVCWADSLKMACRFQGPLPVLPALFAGKEGEQMVNFHSVQVGQDPWLVTDRRVTEGELRRDGEIVRITAAGPGSPTPQAREGWQQSSALPTEPAGQLPNQLAVVVMPNGGTALTGLSGPQQGPMQVMSPFGGDTAKSWY